MLKPKVSLIIKKMFFITNHNTKLHNLHTDVFRFLFYNLSLIYLNYKIFKVIKNNNCLYHMCYLLICFVL